MSLSPKLASCIRANSIIQAKIEGQINHCAHMAHRSSANSKILEVLKTAISLHQQQAQLLKQALQ